MQRRVEDLLGAEARRWIKTLPTEVNAELERLGPRRALPEWLLDAGPGGDFLPLAAQITAYAQENLRSDVREKTMGTMGDSMFVIAAARLLPGAEPLREQLMPLLDRVWAALHDKDHTLVLLALPEIAAIAGKAHQMLDGALRPADVGRRPGSGFDDEPFVDEYLRRIRNERPEPLKADISQRMPGGGSPESKRKRLERGVSARKNSLPSSPMK